MRKQKQSVHWSQDIIHRHNPEHIRITQRRRPCHSHLRAAALPRAPTGYATMIILIGFIIVPLIFVIALIFGILGAVAAYNRRPFRYPFNIRFIK